MSFWMLFKNVGSIMALVRAVKELVGSVAVSHEMPPKEIVKQVLDAIEDLLDRGVIDIPGVEEKDISDALKQIEEQLMK